MISFESVNACDLESLNDLKIFYNEIYSKNFSSLDEKESLENLIFYLSQSNSNCINHIVLVKDERGKVIGGCVFDFFKQTNVAIFEFITIEKESQNKGIGKQTFNHCLEILNAEAQQINKRPLSFIFCEIEKQKENEKKPHLYFWNSLNFKLIDFDYAQPPLSKDKNSVYDLWLIVSGSEQKISGKFLLSVIADYMKFCMQTNYKTSKEYKFMLSQLKNKDLVLTKNLL